MRDEGKILFLFYLYDCTERNNLNMYTKEEKEDEEEDDDGEGGEVKE